jgi:hypothetical protein
MRKYNDMCMIEWNDLTLADYYQVWINGKMELTTPVSFYPYPEALPKGTVIEIHAVQNGQIIASKSKEI